MHISDTLLVAGLAYGVAAGPAHDNCYRALAGNSGASSACAAFFQQPSVTPCTTTTTLTTYTSTSWVAAPTLASKRAVEQPKLVARTDVTPAPTCGVATAVPTFASFCSGASRFSSACNGNGFSGSMAVTAAPVTSSTTTSLVATSTLNACSQRTLNIQIVGGPYDGQFLSGGMFLARGSNNPNFATQFTLDPQGQLSYLGSSSTYYIQESYNPANSGSYVVNGATPQISAFVTPKCSVAADSTFSCTANNLNQPGFMTTFFGGNSASAVLFADSIQSSSQYPTALNLVAVNLACSS